MKNHPVLNQYRYSYRLLLVVALLFLSPGAFTQDLQKRITLKLVNRPVAELLVEISRLASVDFSFNPQSVPVDQIVTVNVQEEPLKNILDRVLLPHGISYSLVENHVVLKKTDAREKTSAAGSTVAAARHTLSGYLRDRSTGEALIGANVYVKESSVGATTNGYGFYSLTLPAGRYPVVCSYVGYREVVREIDISENTRYSVEMEENRLEIGEVEVVAANGETDKRDPQMSGIRFNRKDLSRLPGFGGNLDIIRALQAVPGIQTYGDGSALYYVRGGNSDQNLLLIDEVPVYNPSHLFGFFSAFSPGAINDVQVYKGDFPAKFGGRLSSVIDIKAREGNMKRFGFSGNAGPYASDISLEGPILKNRASFFISGRISTLNWLNNIRSLDKTFDFRFFDVNAKINFRLNDNNRFFLTFYSGLDDLDQPVSQESGSYGINWNNLAGTFRWNHLFSSKVFSNTTLNYSRYKYSLILPQDQNATWNSEISNITAKSDFAWYLDPRNTIRMGIEATLHRSDPGNVTYTGEDAVEDIPVVAQYHSMEYVLYASNEQRAGKKLSFRYGLRLPVWQDIGPTSVCYFDANHHVIDTIGYGSGHAYSTVFSPEPRLNIRYLLDERSALNASYSRTTQFLQLLSASTSPFTSLEVWAPCGPNIPAQTADQVAGGYTLQLARAGFTLSAEAYYKWFHDHLDYKDHANMLFNTLIEGELRFGKAWSYGIELMLRKTTGNLTGWIGYTWSRAFIRTPGVNDGNTYRATYDRPHNVCVNLSYDTRKHWTFTANWIFLTGNPVTMPVGFYYYNGYSVPVYGGKNNERLPDYHRLDLSVSYAFNKPGSLYRHSLSLTLYNAYGRKNPFSVNYNKMMNDKGDFVVPANLNGSYRLLPTSISVAGIIPSLNYQFNF